VPIDAIKAGLPQTSLPALFQAIAAQSPEAFAAVPGLTPEIQIAVSDSLIAAYSWAFKYVYYAALAIGGVAVIAASFLKDYDPLMTGHMPKQLYASGETAPRYDLEKKAESGDGVSGGTPEHITVADGEDSKEV
jgi:hypothetical protein